MHQLKYTTQFIEMEQLLFKFNNFNKKYNLLNKREAADAKPTTLLIFYFEFLGVFLK